MNEKSSCRSSSYKYGMLLLMVTLVLPVPGLTYSLLVGSSILLKGCGTGGIKRCIT
ncbi:hypothetical protein ABEY80_08390 [Priestia megaterium]